MEKRNRADGGRRRKSEMIEGEEEKDTADGRMR